MSKVKSGELITLENGEEYNCVSAIVEEGTRYLYLITNKRPIKVKFAKQSVNKNDSLITLIGRKEEKEKVLKLFQGNINQK